MSAAASLGRWRLAGAAATAVIVLSGPLHLVSRSLRKPLATESPEALWVGSEKCAPCHQEAYRKWKGSHHAQAMQAATEATVLGDFRDATWKHRGKTWRFFKRDAKFLAEAEGPDGALHEYEVAYTFGVAPLQQYLVPFPGGRLQCLSAAWDVERKRWFFVYPGSDDVPPDDWLHWTRPGQNWNTMCADCHSTAVRKRYEPESGLFRTTWSEIAVGCEACHGPGSRHVAWASQPPMARRPVPDFALMTRTKGYSNREFLDLCFACHSRRAQFADQGNPGGEPLDRYLPVTLSEGLFHADGQILEEDFEVHAFAQSRMFEKGVRCSDCHDVHRAKRHKEGNELCTRCHRADTYDVKEHHFHRKEVQGRPSRGALCVSCHMPEKPFMVVHLRRDHSIRVPRPDLSESLGTPNACGNAGCHADKPLSWQTAAYRKWYGAARKPHWGSAIAAGRRGVPEASGLLAELAQDLQRPAIARATALELLGRYPGTDSAALFEKALADPDPLIRRTAASQMPSSDPERLAKALAPRLADPVRAVRAEAAARLVSARGAEVPEARRPALEKALAEYVAAQRYMSDMPSGPYNLANLALARGDAAEAERQYRAALRVDGRSVPALSNLATLLSGQGRLEEAEELLERARELDPRSAPVAFNLGLLLAERGKPKEAETALRAALEADPRLAAAAFNLGALVGERSPREAAGLCRRAASLRPDEPRYAFSQAFYEARSGAAADAARTLEALLVRHPAHADAYLLLSDLYLRAGREADAAALLERGSKVEALPEEVRTALAARARGTK